MKYCYSKFVRVFLQWTAKIAQFWIKFIKNLTIWKCFNFRFKKDKNFSNTALESSDLRLSFPDIFGYRHGTQICSPSYWISLTNRISIFPYSHFMYNCLLWVPSWYPKFSYFKSIHFRLSIAVTTTFLSFPDPNLQLFELQ